MNEAGFHRAFLDGPLTPKQAEYESKVASRDWAAPFGSGNIRMAACNARAEMKRANWPAQKPIGKFGGPRNR